ncbi:uncharacterized protein LOC101856945 [Aplysia californica]|uniref:Uncharacterized protein LOC101856945 n=1 Tax=Aplysia californica TaxID=6500 RepID=A0ABM1ADJ5_APLCA|nr:uncharacterized protein LOC101856945 [Aplysia californica]
MVVRGYFRELTGSAGLRSDDDARQSEQIAGCCPESTIQHSARGEYQPLSDSAQESKDGIDDYTPCCLGLFFLSFSVRSNGAKLLSLKTGSWTITCVNGIRFFSMSWVVLRHTFRQAKEGKSE